MKDPIELGPNAGPIPLGSDTMTQASFVPKWGVIVAHSAQLKRHVCVGMCPAPSQEPKRYMSPRGFSSIVITIF